MQPSLIKIREAVCWQDFFKFQQYYLGLRLSAPTPPFHHEIIQLFESEHNLIGVVAPREHAKTTLVSRQYPLWRMIYNKDPFIILVGESYKMAKRHLATIHFELTENERLRQDFSIKFETEREDELTIRTQYGRSTIVSIGCGQSPRGYLDRYGRPTLILVDDLEEIKRVQNPDLRDEDHEWLIGTLRPCLANYGKLGMIGTLLHEDAVLARICGSYDRLPMEGWATKTFKAIQDDGTALWPEHKPIELLEATKREYERANKIHLFYREWQADPRHGKDAEFSDNWIQWVDLSDPEKKEWWDKKKEKLNWYFTCDTAWAKKNPKSDYSSCVVTGWDEFYNCFVMPPVRGKWGIFETWDQIVKLKELYPIRRYGIERGATKSALDDVLTRENRLRGWQIRFDDLDISCGNQALIRAFFMLFARGEVYFVGNKNGDEFKEVIEEERSFPTGIHDDLAVALAHSVQLARPAPSPKAKRPELFSGDAILDELEQKRKQAI